MYCKFLFEKETNVKINGITHYLLVAILSGVRNQNNHELGQEMFDRMNDKFPQADKSWGSASVLLANTYASAGDIDTSTDIKIRLGKSGIKKQVGISWTVVNGQFFVSNKSFTKIINNKTSFLYL